MGTVEKAKQPQPGRGKQKLHESAQKSYEAVIASRISERQQALLGLFQTLYGKRPDAEQAFDALLLMVKEAAMMRSQQLILRDDEKSNSAAPWYLSNQLVGMSLYIDRFCGSIKGLSSKMDYLEQLGVNLLHLMPFFESPAGESDGGYAVSDFRKVDARLGTMEDLQMVQADMQQRGMYLMSDIVLNHTSHLHPWAMAAKAGDPYYQDFFYMFPDRQIPDEYESGMPEVFPEAAPGNFTYNEEMKQWVMTVFHRYQWDLNYTNPAVLQAMLDTILFHANLGVDVLRIDAPAFIWKKPGTDCQNLDEAHLLLRIIRLCVEIAAPGMALLGEAIVAPAEIMKYFGTDRFRARECHFAYNATQMAVQWDALATADTRVMLHAQHQLLDKPLGTSWITYTRCHDDIGLGYDDHMIAAAGYNPFEHRRFIKDYYSGVYPGSVATGALFAVNPKTQDARISGSLASLCGLEKAIQLQQEDSINTAIRRIMLMQAQSMMLGGLPMLFYGDELGHVNDYSYLNDSGKSYDNRWMHRPIIGWDTIDLEDPSKVETRVYRATQKLIAIRKQLPALMDLSNIQWASPHNIHVAAFVRYSEHGRVFCLFNYAPQDSWVTWYVFRELGWQSGELIDHWSGQSYQVGSDREHLVLEPYQFMTLVSK